MLDLEAEVLDLKTRVGVLETNSLSGMPGTTIAERFTSLHDRVDAMGRNLLDQLDRRFTVLDGRITDTRAEMRRGFEQVNARLDLIDLRFEQVDARFEEIDARFEKIDARFERIEGDIADLKSDVADLKSGMTDIKSMLVSLGAKVPEQN